MATHSSVARQTAIHDRLATSAHHACEQVAATASRVQITRSRAPIQTEEVDTGLTSDPDGDGLLCPLEATWAGEVMRDVLRDLGGRALLCQSGLCHANAGKVLAVRSRRLARNSDEADGGLDGH